MPDIATTVAQLMTDGSTQRIAANPMAQFGTAARRYIGAEILPERTVTERAFRDDSIRYRTVIANSGSRYSPAQKKGANIAGSMLVELGDNDIAGELDAREYDMLVDLLGSNATIDAMAQLIGFLDKRANLPLIELNELHRWQAICNAVVQRRGDNKYTEDVNYPNPSGHRVTAAAAWSNNATDPMADITGRVDFLAAKGYTVSRIITTRAVLSILAGNAEIKKRAGVAAINASGQITSAIGRVSMQGLAGIFESDGLPAPEIYDLQYLTQTGSGYFYPRGCMTFICSTGRDASVDRADADPVVLQNTLGYMAIGRAAGQPTPGRKLRMQAFDNKPPRVEVEGWETSLPVIQDPEATATISSIS